MNPIDALIAKLGEVIATPQGEQRKRLTEEALAMFGPAADSLTSFEI